MKHYSDNIFRGWSLAGTGALLLSVDAVLIKAAGLGPIQAACWRSLLIAAGLFGYLVLTRNTRVTRQFMGGGPPAYLLAVLHGLNTTLFVISVSYTLVANTVFILSSTMLFSALFSRWLLQESLPGKSWAVLFTSLAGVGCIFFGSLSAGTWTGNLTALLLAISTGLLFTLARKHDTIPRVPPIMIGSLTAGLLLLPFASVAGASPESLAWLCLAGLFIKPLASVLMLTATRFANSSDVGLLLLLEPLFAAILAWWFLAERLNSLILTGGAIIAGCILLQAIIHQGRNSLRYYVR